MDRSGFYARIRPMTGALSQVQVQVIEALLDAAKGMPAAYVAYILATAWGEAKMTPQRENMRYSASRIRQVWPSRPEAVKFANNPQGLANSVYGGRLGNRKGTDDGWRYRGGGIDQLTGRTNYARIGIAEDPEAILRPEIAVKSIINGMTTGRYTGKRLADYDRSSGFDFVAARAIVNGDVRLNGAKYAGYAQTFLDALKKGGWGAPSSISTTPRYPVQQPSWLAAFLNFFRSLLKSITLKKGK